LAIGGDLTALDLRGLFVAARGDAVALVSVATLLGTAICQSFYPHLSSVNLSWD